MGSQSKISVISGLPGIFMLVSLAGLAASICVAAEKNTDDRLWMQIYDRPQCLADLNQPVVVYLDIQLEDIMRGAWNKMEDPLKQANPSRMRQRFRELSGLDCLVFHRSEVSVSDLERSQIKAILISGRNTTDVPPDDRPFYDLIRNTTMPMIGFCGGGQLIGKAYGFEITKMRQLKEGENDPSQDAPHAEPDRANLLNSNARPEEVDPKAQWKADAAKRAHYETDADQ